MRTGLCYRITAESDLVVVRPIGRLSTSTYGELRDHLLKQVMDQPRALVVDLAELAVDAEPLLSVFASVWLRTCDWPAVPLLIAAPSGVVPDGTALRRYVSVHETVDSALDAVESPPPRKRAHRTFPGAPAALSLAREFIGSTCRDWAVTKDVAGSAALVGTELVTNAVQHTISEVRLRMELRGRMLTVAVSDDDPTPAILRDPGGAGHDSGLGLLIVTQVAATWGCVPDHGRGRKTVWAVLRVPEGP